MRTPRCAGGAGSHVQPRTTHARSCNHTHHAHTPTRARPQPHHHRRPPARVLTAPKHSTSACPPPLHHHHHHHQAPRSSCCAWVHVRKHPEPCSKAPGAPPAHTSVVPTGTVRPRAPTRGTAWHTQVTSARWQPAHPRQPRSHGRMAHAVHALPRRRAGVQTHPVCLPRSALPVTAPRHLHQHPQVPTNRRAPCTPTQTGYTQLSAPPAMPTPPTPPCTHHPYVHPLFSTSPEQKVPGVRRSCPHAGPFPSSHAPPTPRSQLGKLRHGR